MMRKISRHDWGKRLKHQVENMTWHSDNSKGALEAWALCHSYLDRS